MKRLRILIASGPTREPIDPVRFLSNYSTGVMGRALASAAKKKGHRVTLVQCPEDAETARDLQKKLTSLLPKHDALIMAAAVCDARPASVASGKIKKESLSVLRLVKNPDILAVLGKKKKASQAFVGFGLESKNLIKNGMDKLKRKHLEFIVLQSVNRRKTPFGDKKIEAFLLQKDGKKQRFASISKPGLAARIILNLEALFRAKKRDSA